MTKNLDSAHIECVFAVNYTLDRNKRSTQYVVLLKDSSYVCTCLLLQNNGIVCRHFFHCMQADPRFKYHLKLIPRRWHTELEQDNVSLDVSTKSFVQAFIHTPDSGGDVADIPGDSYMNDVLDAFPMSPTILPDDQHRLSQKRQFAELSGRFKEVNRALENNPDLFEMVKTSFDDIIIKSRGVDEMLDPENVKAKGRPRKSRLKSSVETRMRSTKCGVCNEVGHNARKHHGQQKELV